MPRLWASSLGECTELLREKFGIDRERQDAFALRSHQLAAQAWDDGFYDDHVIAVPDTDLDRDESIRPEASLEGLARLTPSFRKDNGTVTAGNASPLTDGASAMFIGGAKASELLGQQPLARICGRGAAALEPQLFGIAPVEAANRALAQAGIGWDEVGVVELNEAFAAQSLACLGQWPIDPKIVNPYGGAIAIGHPLGASGGRLIATLARGMKAQGARYGVAAVCIGVGQGLAMVLENTEVGHA
jgi:acetyl-CoA acyltransferase